jgi:hypothetical protein
MGKIIIAALSTLFLAFIVSLYIANRPQEKYGALTTAAPTPLPELQYITDPNDIIHRLPQAEQRWILEERRKNFKSVLEEQLYYAGVPAEISSDGGKVYVTVGKASLVAKARQMLCRGRWPSKYGEIHFFNTLRHLRQAGLAKIGLRGGGESADFGVGPGGDCAKE